MEGKGIHNTNILDKVIVSLNGGGRKSRDISASVKKIDITESITGGMSGTLDIVDTNGTIDSFFLTGDEVINIRFIYFKTQISVAFHFNGISNINTTSATHSKSYQIMLGSLADYSDASYICSKCYDGDGIEIISQIFSDYFTQLGLSLLTFGKSAAPGNRFIVPSISPLKAIREVRTRIYDDKISNFLLFERLIAPNNYILAPLSVLVESDVFAKLAPKLAFKLKDKENPNPTSYNIGSIGGDVVIQDNINLIHKTARGIFGKKIQHVDISNSSYNIVDFIGKSQPATTITKPFRGNMYNSTGIRSINYPDDLNISLANYKTSVLFGISAVVSEVIAIPGLGVGNMVELNIGDSTVNRKNTTDNGSLKYDSVYMVTNINHIIKEGTYTQNITLVTGVV